MSDGIYSQPAATGTGNDVRTKVVYAIETLKLKSPASITAETLVRDNIRNQERTPEMIARFHAFMKANEKVAYHKDTDSYSFRPVHDIYNADDLIGFLQSQKSALGLYVPDLKDGWVEAEKAINQLESEKKLLVVRNKKDNNPRWVWADDPTLNAPLDDEFVQLWHEINMPEHAKIVDALNRKGMVSADSGAMTAAKVVKKEKPKKKIRRGGKVTNTHMAGVLRDYSHLKR